MEERGQGDAGSRIGNLTRRNEKERLLDTVHSI